MTRAAQRPKRPQIRHAAPTATRVLLGIAAEGASQPTRLEAGAVFDRPITPPKRATPRVMNLPGAPVDRVRTPTGVHRDLKSDRWLRCSRKLLTANLAAVYAQARFTTSIANGALWFHAV